MQILLSYQMDLRDNKKTIIPVAAEKKGRDLELKDWMKALISNISIKIISGKQLWFLPAQTI